MHICILPLKAFVDPTYPTWLVQGIPTNLRTALEREFGSNLERIPWDTSVNELFGRGFEAGRFETYLTDALISTHNPMLAVHGMPHHQRILDNGDEGMRVMQQIVGTLPPELLQAHLYGLGTHDKGHPGATFFAMAAPGSVPVDDDVDPQLTPVEAYTAKLVDVMMVRVGFSLLARLVANYTIISSAFGAGHPEHGPRLALGNVKPTSIFGCLMRTVDITPVASHSIAINDETALTYLEVPAFPRPQTWREYLNSRGVFLDYATVTHDQLDASVAMWLPAGRAQRYSLTRELGWRGNLESSVRNLREISAGGGNAPVKSAILRARLATLGVSLT